MSVFPKPPAGYKPMPDSEIVEHEYDENEPDEFEEAIGNCCGWFEEGENGRFVCYAAGSEDCDWECPFSRDIGMTAEEIEARDEQEYAEGAQPDAPYEHLKDKQ